MKRVALISILLALALGSQVSDALAETIYKWVDENGTVVFGSMPPEGVDAEIVELASGNPINTVPAYDTQASQEKLSIAQQKRDERAERRQKAEQDKAMIEAACLAEKDKLARLEPRPKVIIQNPDGTTRMMGDQERLDLINDAKKFIADNCED